MQLLWVLQMENQKEKQKSLDKWQKIYDLLSEARSLINTDCPYCRLYNCICSDCPLNDYCNQESNDELAYWRIKKGLDHNITDAYNLLKGIQSDIDFNKE